jgi:hypothetical protein
VPVLFINARNWDPQRIAVEFVHAAFYRINTQGTSLLVPPDTSEAAALVLL